MRPSEGGRRVGEPGLQGRGFRTRRGFPLSTLLSATAITAASTAMAQEMVPYETQIPTIPEQPFTIRQGDLRLLIATSLGIDWTDNVNTTRFDPQDDVILRPMLNLTASYPLTQKNLLRLNVGVGYDFYLDNDDLSTWRLTSDSALMFEMQIKDLLIDIHSRAAFTRDSAQSGEVANTALQGTFVSTSGIGLKWGLGDVVLSGGYDRQYAISIANELSYQDRETDIISLRAGLQLHPQLQVGVESPLSFTRYDEPVLNDNTGYGGGVYADWRPGSVFSIQPRVGYNAYDFKQTSQTILARDVDSFYGGVTLAHQPREAIGYNLSFGHELRLGLQTDAVEATYARLGVNWAIMRRVTLRPGFFYEHGKQDGQGVVAGSGSETYDWYGPDVTVALAVVENLSLSLNYRLTLRDSDNPGRGYTQNRVGLLATYTFR